MVRRRRLAPLLGALLLLTGCWGRLELNDVGLVTGIAVDQGQGNDVRVALYLARGKGGGSTGPSHWLVQAEAPTIPDAIRHISRTSSRRIILDHVRVVVIGERYARTGTGISDLMDFAGRHSEIRMTPRVLLSQGEGIEMLAMEPHLEAEQPEGLVKKLEAKGGLNPMLKHILVAALSETHSPWFYTVRRQSGTLRTKGRGKGAAEISGMALLKNNLLVDILPIPETRSMAVLLGHPDNSELSVPCSGEPEKRFSVRLSKGNARIEVRLNGKQPAFQAKAETRAILINSECDRANITVTANRKRFEQAVEQQVLGDMERLVKRVQRLQVDPVGFGKRLQLRYPDFFRANAHRWPEIWAQSPVTYELKVRLYHSSLLLDPVNKTRSELRWRE